MTSTPAVTREPLPQQSPTADLPAPLLASLAPVLPGFVAMLTAHLNQQIPAPELQQQWLTLLRHAGPVHTTDASTVIHYVLQRAHIEGLRDSARELRHLTDRKRQTNEELAQAHRVLTATAHLGDGDELPEPFNSSSLEETRGAFTMDTDPASLPGGGLRMLSDQEKKQLVPEGEGDVFITEAGYRIDVRGGKVVMFAPKGADDDGDRVGGGRQWGGREFERVTTIWGDPHVNEANGKGKKSDWHFGGNSTFILPDGTKVCVKTGPSGRDGVTVVEGVDILAGQQRGHSAKKGGASLTNDRVEWDLANKDASKKKHAGVFALQANNQWAMMAKDGLFYDVDNMSFDAYLDNPKVKKHGEPIALGDNQWAAATFDTDYSLPNAQTVAHSAPSTTQTQRAALPLVASALTRAQLEAHARRLEEQLAHINEDCRLANEELHSTMHRRLRALQATSRLLHHGG